MIEDSFMRAIRTIAGTALGVAAAALVTFVTPGIDNPSFAQAFLFAALCGAPGAVLTALVVSHQAEELERTGRSVFVVRWRLFLEGVCWGFLYFLIAALITAIFIGWSAIAMILFVPASLALGGGAGLGCSFALGRRA